MPEISLARLSVNTSTQQNSANSYAIWATARLTTSKKIAAFVLEKVGSERNYSFSCLGQALNIFGKLRRAMKKIYKYKNVPGVEKEFEYKPYGHQLPSLQAICEFKKTAKEAWLHVKRRSIASALRQFISLYEPTAYYFDYFDPTDDYKDDTCKIYYKGTD